VVEQIQRKRRTAVVNLGGEVNAMVEVV